jgi:hypothetical protein
MKMNHILKYFFNFCLLFCVLITKAQDVRPNTKPLERTKLVGEIPEVPKKVTTKTTIPSKTDTIVPVKKDRYGLRVGIDVYRFTRNLYDSNYKGLELTGDFRLTKKYYLAAEVGSENKINEDIRLLSTTRGTYLKAGFDYNVYDNLLDMENIISIGLRGGFSTFSQELNTYKIYNSNRYWDVDDSTTAGEKYNGLTAAWIEVVAGLKVKVYNNIFVGFSLRMNTLLFDKNPSSDFKNLYIPGFNRTYDGNFGAGFNYTVTYFIPLYKKIAPPKK